jgi:hypothetical protein
VYSISVIFDRTGLEALAESWPEYVVFSITGIFLAFFTLPGV